MGVVWSLIMAACFGFSQLSTRKGLVNIAVDQGTFIMIVVSTILMSVPFFWLDGVALARNADWLGLAYFISAGLVHFVGGFTFMNLSISTIGAARTGSLIATTPLFATFLAAFALNELINLPLIIGVVVVIGGVRLIASSKAPKPTSQTAAPQRQMAALGITAGNINLLNWAGTSTFGLLAAFSWGITPVLIKKGLETIPSPVVGVTLSMAAAGIAYALILGFRSRLWPTFAYLRQPGGQWQIAAGLLIGLGTLARWLALSFTTAAIVTTLSRGSLLITVGLGGKLLGKDLEPVNKRVVWGATLIVIGATVVVLFGRP